MISSEGEQWGRYFIYPDMVNSSCSLSNISIFFWTGKHSWLIWMTAKKHPTHWRWSGGLYLLGMFNMMMLKCLSSMLVIETKIVPDGLNTICSIYWGKSSYILYRFYPPIKYWLNTILSAVITIYSQTPIKLIFKSSIGWNIHVSSVQNPKCCSFALPSLWIVIILNIG